MKLLFVDHTAGHDPRKLYDKPSGGTLTSLTHVPRYLASRGHDVYVQSEFEETADVDGVHYVKSESQIPKWDVAIMNRNVVPKDFMAYNKRHGIKTVWWLHDIVDTKYLIDDTFRQFDRVVALSRYCKRTYSKFYSIPEDMFSIIPNGIDPEVFKPGDYAKRNPNVYITASSLIKGYYALDTTYINLKRHNPELDFRIYSNQSLHGFKNNKAQEDFLNKMIEGGAHVYAPVSQGSMAEIMRQAWCLLMPNSYPEICSNLLLQARASGLPVVSSGIGANPEFLEHEKTGMVTQDFYPHDLSAWMVEFAGMACRLLVDGDLHRRISEASPQGVPTWANVGEAWNGLIQAL